jgi:hypothetical protein
MPGTSFLAPARNSTELHAILNERTGLDPSAAPPRG